MLGALPVGPRPSVLAFLAGITTSLDAPISKPSTTKTTGVNFHVTSDGKLYDELYRAVQAMEGNPTLAPLIPQQSSAGLKNTCTSAYPGSSSISSPKQLHHPRTTSTASRPPRQEALLEAAQEVLATSTTTVMTMTTTTQISVAVTVDDHRVGPSTENVLTANPRKTSTARMLG